MHTDGDVSSSTIINTSRSTPLIRASQLAMKLSEVRKRAEQEGQVYTNLPRERFADATFDEAPKLVEFPSLKRVTLETAATQPSSPYFTPISPERMEMHRWTSSSSSQAGIEVSSPLPFAEETLPCTRCHSPTVMRRIFLWEFVGSILTHACSVCSDSLAASSTVKCLVPNYRFPVAHECESCGWRVCLGCNMRSSVQKEVRRSSQIAESETEGRLRGQMAVVERQIEQLTIAAAEEATRSGSVSASMLEACKDTILDLEARLAAEKRSKDQLSALLASLQKEYIQYKADVEMHLESNAAEQVLLQSRLVEQSVLLADARARVDELTSTQRCEAAESVLASENRQLKEEIDALKVSIHLDFDNWKRGVMKQVKGECLKYRERLRQSLRIDSQDWAPEPDDGDNEKELDYLFDEVDWTGGVDDLSPEKMKQYIESSRASTPERMRSENVDS